MLNYIALLFLSVSISLCASSDENVMRVYKTNGIAHIALKIEDDHSAKSGLMVIKFAPSFSKRLSTSQRYIIPFAKPKDLALWAEYDYVFGNLVRVDDQVVITEKGISILFSQATLNRIEKLQRNSHYAVVLTAPLTEEEVGNEFVQIPPLKRSNTEKESPFYVIKKLLYQD